MKKTQQKFSWKDFLTFSKYGWVTLFLTLILGVSIELEMFSLSQEFKILNPKLFWSFTFVGIFTILLGVILGRIFKISEIVSELLAVLPLFFVPVVLIPLSNRGILRPPFRPLVYLVLLVGDQIAVCSFIQLSFERINSWKLRKQRYDRVKALMSVRKAYDPAIEKYLNLTCDKEIIKRLQKDFEIQSSNTETSKGEK